MTDLGTWVAIEIPVVSAALLTAAGWFASRVVGRLDVARTEERQALAARMQRHEDGQRTLAEGMSEQSRALAILVSNAPDITHRLGRVENNVTGVREATAALKGTLDALLTGHVTIYPPRES